MSSGTLGVSSAFHMSFMHSDVVFIVGGSAIAHDSVNVDGDISRDCCSAEGKDGNEGVHL